MSISERQLTVIRCEAPGCPAEFVGTEDALQREVIGAALDAGWDIELLTVQPDLCPDHYGTVIP